MSGRIVRLPRPSISDLEDWWVTVTLVANPNMVEHQAILLLRTTVHTPSMVLFRHISIFRFIHGLERHCQPPAFDVQRHDVNRKPCGIEKPDGGSTGGIVLNQGSVVESRQFDFGGTSGGASIGVEITVRVVGRPWEVKREKRSGVVVEGTLDNGR
jgi:hypothetical protein